MRPRRTWARSYCACCSSQPSSVPPKTLDSLTAISGDMPRFPLTSSESVLRVTPRAAAASVMVKPDGWMHWRKTTSGMRWVFHGHGLFSRSSGNRHNQRPPHRHQNENGRGCMKRVPGLRRLGRPVRGAFSDPCGGLSLLSRPRFRLLLVVGKTGSCPTLLPLTIYKIARIVDSHGQTYRPGSRHAGFTDP